MNIQVRDIDFPDKRLVIRADGDWQGWRSRACAKEPETVEWIRSFEGISVLWDVGASVGPYSLIAAALGHKVVAFEPFAPSYGHLQQNIWLNEMDEQISASPVALTNGDPLQRLHFKVSDIHPGSALHNKDGEHWQFVMGFKADDFAVEGILPDHVKIDVDGSELAVIQGGENVWDGVQSIMLESEPPDVDAITVILNGAGLELVDSWKRMGDKTVLRNYLYRRSE